MKFTELSEADWESLSPKPTIQTSTGNSPWGHYFIALVGQSICSVELISAEMNYQEWQNTLFQKWPGASHVQGPLKRSFTLLLKGTPFQRAVWRVLLATRPGETLHYQTIAEKLNAPKALRAIGNAVGSNPIALFIPCHRVIPKRGGIGGYKWGIDRKKRLLEWEAKAKREPYCFR